MEQVQKAQGISNNRYNTYLENIQGVYRAFIKYDVFDVSPMTGFERLKEPEPVSFATLTVDEKKKVYERLSNNYPNFLTFFLMIYHTALRPKELVSLQIHNYSEKGQCFMFTPDETVTLYGEVHNKTKTNLTRYVPIPPEALELMKAMNLSQYPKEYYVFSEGFKPGAINIPRKRATEVWNKEIISEKTGLGINKKMYGAKHLGIDDKLENDTSIEAIQHQAGHTTSSMTKRYSKKIKEVYQREIDEKSKGFLE